MNQKRYEVVRGELFAKAQAIEEAKRPAYTRGNEDVLHNFKSAGEAAKITAEQAWLVHAKKQWDAICAIMTQPDLIAAEPPIERFADLVNYLKLGWAMYCERRDANQTEGAYIPYQHVPGAAPPDFRELLKERAVDRYLNPVAAEPRTLNADDVLQNIKAQTRRDGWLDKSDPRR